MEKGEVKEAIFWKPLKEKKVKCGLCRQRCVIPPEKYGICGIRKNIDGKLNTLLYGKVSSSNPDPVEKKPLRLKGTVLWRTWMQHEMLSLPERGHIPGATYIRSLFGHQSS